MTTQTTAQTTRDRSRPSRTQTRKTTTRKATPDPAQLWDISARWHSTVRGLLQGIMDSVTAIEMVIEDSDHPLAAIFNQADFPEFTKSLEQTICSFVNIAPPAPCPYEIPDPLSLC